MKKFLTIFIALTVVLLIASCQNVLDNKEVTGEGATLIVSLGSENERTLSLTGDDQLDGIEYWLTITSNYSSEPDFNGNITKGKPVVLKNMYPERYVIVGEAFIWYDADPDDPNNSLEYVLIATQEMYADLRPGQLHHATIILEPAYTSDKPGYFEYDIRYPGWDLSEDDQDKQYSNIKKVDNTTELARLTLVRNLPNSGDVKEVVNLLDKYKGVLTLPAGLYDMTIELRSNRYSAQEQNIMSFREKVYIYPTKTTSTIGSNINYYFTEEYFTSMIHLFGSAKLTNYAGNTDPYTLKKVIVYYDGEKAFSFNDDVIYAINSTPAWSPNSPVNILYGRDGDVSDVKDADYWVLKKNDPRLDIFGITPTGANVSSGKWDLFIDSHLFKDNTYGAYTNAKFRILAENATGEQVYSKLYNIPLQNRLGSSSTDADFVVDSLVAGEKIEIVTAAMSLANDDPTSLADFSGNVTFNKTVASNGWTKFTIENPDGYGLDANGILIRSTGPVGSTPRTFLTSPESGKYDAYITVPDSQGAPVELIVNFFHLSGTLEITSQDMITNGYSITGSRIDAYVGNNILPPNPLANQIGSATLIQRPGTNIYDWDFDLTDYVWRNGAYDCTLQVNFTYSLGAADEWHGTVFVNNYMNDADEIEIYSRNMQPQVPGSVTAALTADTSNPNLITGGFTVQFDWSPVPTGGGYAIERTFDDVDDTVVAPTWTALPAPLGPPDDWDINPATTTATDNFFFANPFVNTPTGLYGLSYGIRANSKTWSENNTVMIGANPDFTVFSYGSTNFADITFDNVRSISTSTTNITPAPTLAANEQQFFILQGQDLVTDVEIFVINGTVDVQYSVYRISDLVKLDYVGGGGPSIYPGIDTTIIPTPAAGDGLTFDLSITGDAIGDNDKLLVVVEAVTPGESGNFQFRIVNTTP